MSTNKGILFQLLLGIALSAVVIGLIARYDVKKPGSEIRYPVPPGYDCFMAGNQVVCHPVTKEVRHGDGFDRP